MPSPSAREWECITRTKVFISQTTQDKEFGGLVFLRGTPRPCIIRFVDMPDHQQAVATCDAVIAHHPKPRKSWFKKSRLLRPLLVASVCFLDRFIELGPLPLHHRA